MSILKKNTNKNSGITTAGGPTPPPTNGITTRQTRRSTISQEDIEALPSTVMNINHAKDYLAKNLLCHIDQPFTLCHITSTLFHITQLKAILLPAIEAIRAVVFILKSHEANEIAELVSEHISTNLTPKIAEHVVAAIAPQVARILTTSENLDSTLKEADRLRTTIEREKDERNSDLNTVAEHLEEATGNLFESIEECNKSMKLLSRH
ncbi:hypothetical protein EV424DRAFT_1352180 [Suillus variegatus]|nr:hypothetical protein EV424DRAFT_1352180 [Suillus variegatus]